MKHSLLDQAIRLAAEAHAGQTEKNGRPYVLHPLRLMFKMHDELEMAAAVLHDVVEDTDWTLERLTAAGFPSELVRVVDCLTRRPGAPYVRYTRRAAANPVARRVKLADLEDNLDLRRLPALAAKDLARTLRYHRAWRTLRQSDRS
jgi:(p)ppGpp synthase/HD superfamily hydrolase